MIGDEKKCVICGSRSGLEEHHCMSGIADRPKCDKLGLTVWLCNNCHRLAHNKPKESGIYYFLKRYAQIYFEKNHTRKEWLSIFHKNYL